MKHEMRLGIVQEQGYGTGMLPYCIFCGWIGQAQFLYEGKAVTEQWIGHMREIRE